MFLTLTAKSITYKPLRFILTVIGLAVAIAGLVSLMSFGEGARKAIRRGLEAYKPRILIYRGDFFMPTPLVPIEMADSVKKMGVGDVFRLVRIAKPIGFPPKGMAIVMGMDFASRIRFIEDYTLLEGRDLSDSLKREALIGEKVAQTLGYTIGDTVEVGKGKYVIVGIIKSPSGISTNAIVVPVNLLIKDYDFKNILAVSIVPEDIEKTDSIAQLLKERFPDYQVQTTQEMARLTESMVAIGDIIRFALSAIALFVATVSLFAIMAITVQERTWEFGVLRALGGTRRLIFSLVLAQAILISLLGWALGIIFGLLIIKLINVVAYQKLGFEFATLTIRLVLFSLLIAIGIGIAGGFFPALTAVRKSIREAIGRI